MNIDEVRTFVTIAELGGFTRAADRLNRSQPAISRRISLLEQELQAPLLERVRGGIRLTAAGRAFLPYAEAMLAAMQDGREAIRDLLHEERGSLSLALVGTLADTRIVEVLRDFAQRADGVKLELRTASSRQISDLVRRAEVTLGLRYFPDDNPDLLSETVGAEALRVVASAEHPLAGRHLSDARALRGEAWVGFPVARAEPESHGHLLQRQLSAAGLIDAQITPIDSLTAQKRLVEAGFGLALMTESSIGEELRLGSLALIDVPALRALLPIALIHRKRGFLSPAAQSLRRLVRTELGRL